MSNLRYGRDLADTCYDTEVSFEKGTDFQKLLAECKQNPDHKKFVPAAEFTKENLPERFRGSDLFEFIQVLAELTVRLLVTATSNERLLNTQIYYPYYPGHGLVGRECVRAGSGLVRNVTVYDEASSEPCPCFSCETSQTPHKVWGRISVASATHLVFNTEEAKYTKADLYFTRNAKEPGTSECCQIEGYYVYYSSLSEDKCLIYFATHDMDLCERLSKLADHREDLLRKINEKYDKDQESCLAVVVSYPHACTKQISLSQWASKELNIDCTWWAKATYTPITCAGSSGAPVWALGKREIEPWRLRCLV